MVNEVVQCINEYGAANIIEVDKGKELVIILRLSDLKIFEYKTPHIYLSFPIKRDIIKEYDMKFLRGLKHEGNLVVTYFDSFYWQEYK